MNVAQAVNVQGRLMRDGFAVLNPMLSALWPDAWTIDHATWIENDLPWVAVAHVVLRLPGESAGADEECSFARDHNIPVFDTWHDLMEWKTAWDVTQPQVIG